MRGNHRLFNSIYKSLASKGWSQAKCDCSVYDAWIAQRYENPGTTIIHNESIYVATGPEGCESDDIPGESVHWELICKCPVEITPTPTQTPTPTPTLTSTHTTSPTPTPTPTQTPFVCNLSDYDEWKQQKYNANQLVKWNGSVWRAMEWEGTDENDEPDVSIHWKIFCEPTSTTIIETSPTQTPKAEPTTTSTEVIETSPTQTPKAEPTTTSTEVNETSPTQTPKAEPTATSTEVNEASSTSTEDLVWSCSDNRYCVSGIVGSYELFNGTYSYGSKDESGNHYWQNETNEGNYIRIGNVSYGNAGNSNWEDEIRWQFTTRSPEYSLGNGQYSILYSEIITNIDVCLESFNWSADGVSNPTMFEGISIVQPGCGEESPTPTPTPFVLPNEPTPTPTPTPTPISFPICCTGEQTEDAYEHKIITTGTMGEQDNPDFLDTNLFEENGVLCFHSINRTGSATDFFVQTDDGILGVVTIIGTFIGDKTEVTYSSPSGDCYTGNLINVGGTNTLIKI